MPRLGIDCGAHPLYSCTRLVDTAASRQRVIGDFKAYASRRLNMVNDRAIRWAAGGNAARLSSREAIEAAANYVADQQGEPMAVLVAR